MLAVLSKLRLLPKSQSPFYLTPTLASGARYQCLKNLIFATWRSKTASFVLNIAVRN